MRTRSHRHDPKVRRRAPIICPQDTTPRREHESEQNSAPKFVPGVEKKLPS